MKTGNNITFEGIYAYLWVALQTFLAIKLLMVAGSNSDITLRFLSYGVVLVLIDSARKNIRDIKSNKYW